MSRTIVILTALDLEYQAILDQIKAPQPYVHAQGTRFQVGDLASGSGQVVLALVGKGNHAAAVLAERAISEYSPLALCFVGVAGALHSHIQLGDVVVATHVYGYHGGTSEDDGMKSRPRVWETSHRTDQAAREVARRVSAQWAAADDAHADRLPRIHFGPIAAGEVVLNSRTSAEARYVRERYNDALAIEMEGAGVVQAGHLNDALPVAVIRGISDHADGTKHKTDDARWQPRAVRNAATFALELATELTSSEPVDGRGGEHPVELTQAGRAGGPTNIAGRDLVIGAQVDTVHGNLTLSAPPRNQAQP
jgi:adenosylhomocysteine nucleosidase